MVDPRIAAILEARKTLKVAAPSEVKLEREGSPLTSEFRSSLIKQSADQGTLMPAPAPTGDGTIAEFLSTYLPILESDVVELFTFKHGFSLAELYQDATSLIAHVSEAVGKGLPLVKGTEARALVAAAVLWAFNTYAAPRLGPVPSFFIRSGLPLLVQFLYDTVVAPRIGKGK